MYCLVLLILMSNSPMNNGLEIYEEEFETDYIEFDQEEKVYLNSWAVKIIGSPDTADELARKYGFMNRGKIGNLGVYYHFYFPNGRNVFQNTISSILMEDEEISDVCQQTLKIRQKKIFKLPSDPLWKQQWSLYNTGQISKLGTNIDLNVLHAWMQGMTGENVVVSVVDDGIDYYHSDLKNNYDRSASYNFAEHMEDPFPLDIDSETHGTVNAGIVAMQRNSLCGTGVAYKAKIGGIRLDFSSMSDVVESSALGYHNNYIDIYSNGWGPSDNGYTLDGPGQLLQQTLETATQKGRNGLGNIYVWAAGNGGYNGDTCACDGYVSSMYTIAIGSANEYGRQAIYDENCPAKMAVTFSFNSQIKNSTNNFQISSTSTNNQCTDQATGTSASAALTTGVIALALQMNSSLTWRDIQYLLVYTSNPYKLKGGNWTNNGAGLRVSPQFGFGAVDAEAMVMRARYWTTVPKRVSCFLRPETISTLVYKSSAFSTLIKVTSWNCPIVYLEHVIIHATMSIVVDDKYDYVDYYDEDYFDKNPFIIFFKGPRRGAISMKLKSPYGTQSMMLPNRDHDFVNYQGFDHWPFMSVYHWGEDPAGQWYLTIKFDAEGGHVVVTNLSMTLYGTESIPEAVRHASNTCDESCMRGCAYNISSAYCDSCRSLRMVDSLLCVSSCPSKYCRLAGYCQKCPVTTNIAEVAGFTVSSVLLAIAALVAIVTVVLFYLYRRRLRNEGFTRF